MTNIYEEQKQVALWDDPIYVDEDAQEDCDETEEDYDAKGEVYMDF